MRACAGVGRRRRRAAGVTWSLVTSNVPWAARFGHTTVIDAAGTMYLIGGFDDATNLNDVWQSPDKGASRTRGGTPGVLQQYSRGTQRVGTRRNIRRTKGELSALQLCKHVTTTHRAASCQCIYTSDSGSFATYR
jgi:hypothetical protein